VSERIHGRRALSGFALERWEQDDVAN
jgi:hypothetical protein